MLRSEREKLNQLTASREDPVNTEADHFEVCPTCGQAFDCRRLGDVFHHDEPGHAPLPVN
jgi:hypothetical protein